MDTTSQCFLIFGGAGLVGRQVVRQIATHLKPRKIVIASLYEKEVADVINDMKDEFEGESVEWVGEWGNIFVRSDLAFTSRDDMINIQENRDLLIEDLFGDIDEAYTRSHLVSIISKHRPNVIIDAVNTAMALSYQDVYSASAIVRNKLAKLSSNDNEASDKSTSLHSKDTYAPIEVLMLTQTLPQLSRHVMMLYRVLRDVEVGMYLKIGTMGTGGMGLNVPYTHSEDKPSDKLMTKSAAAFAHTGLMMLMSRTPDGPIVKEIKPGAMIGYSDVACDAIKECGKSVLMYESQEELIGHSLNLCKPISGYKSFGNMELPVVYAGENGQITKGEFEAITALGQMEFVTPEEIAHTTVLEIQGSNTGKDVIAALNSSVISPSYRAGYLRKSVIDELEGMEHYTGEQSVALGQLGPPELSKLLWESHLLKLVYSDIVSVTEEIPTTISEKVYELILNNDSVRRSIISIGIPILTPDGKKLLRGPFIRIPEIPGSTQTKIDVGDVDKWATKGWVDLRVKNFAVWKSRFNAMHSSKDKTLVRGSASVAQTVYPFDDIRIGEIVGWIFNNEMRGHRSGIK